MSNDIATLEKDLMLAKQEKEILELKFEMQKIQAKKLSKLDDSLFSMSNYEHFRKIALVMSKTDIVPKHFKDKPDDIFVAMGMGYQLGMPVEQAIQDIAVVNGRPCLWGDGFLAVCISHAECESIEEVPVLSAKGDIVGYSCTVKRKGHQAHTATFTIDDAKIAGLLSKKGTWETYPTRMLQLRARSFALRDKFADALRGIKLAEVEKEDSSVIEGTSVNESASQTKALKALINKNVQAETVVEAVEVKLDEKAQDSLNDILCKIEILFSEKEFTQDRITKALDYYNASTLKDLDINGALQLLKQMERV